MWTSDFSVNDRAISSSVKHRTRRIFHTGRQLCSSVRGLSRTAKFMRIPSETETIDCTYCRDNTGRRSSQLRKRLKVSRAIVPRASRSTKNRRRVLLSRSARRAPRRAHSFSIGDQGNRIWIIRVVLFSYGETSRRVLQSGPRVSCHGFS